jgi:hypothetical protein
MLTTRTQVINYLVTQGKPENFARAMTNEFLNWDSNPNDPDFVPDLIWFTEPSHKDSDVVSITEKEALKFYDDFMGYGVELTPDGITFDYDLTFDTQGNYL